jgi:hypothetical protein
MYIHIYIHICSARDFENKLLFSWQFYDWVLYINKKMETLVTILNKTEQHFNNKYISRYTYIYTTIMTG